ncbi:hypothetical protein CN692_18095 [Bacillus sp. AFS002410]|uniref:hypothetical protein n=1 Tax=Bacillus sp. AFS002410 TaxID=2033481 RepID=UPI000BF1AFD4|nr:hypothetical protein [Bacillus sp. AFS002410]PEJ56251.1 hypothetical protein CN692_18095 [Bacillus sp. AFS002410]
MTEKTIELQTELATENFQKMLQYLLDNQLQIQQWTESLFQEQAKQWKTLNEQVQLQQQESYEQFQEMIKLLNEIKPTMTQESFEKNWKKLFEQFTPFQSLWSNFNQNPYQPFFQAMSTFSNQQQQLFQQFFKQPLNNTPFTAWTNMYQQFQKTQEDWLKNIQEFSFSKL